MKSNFGRQIAQLRKDKGWSQQELADRLGISNKTVSRWECGDGYPDIATLVPLSEALGVSVDFLLKGEHEQKESAPVLSAVDESFAAKAIGRYRRMRYLELLIMIAGLLLYFVFCSIIDALPAFFSADNTLKTIAVMLFGVLALAMILLDYFALHRVLEKNLNLPAGSVRQAVRRFFGTTWLHMVIAVTFISQTILLPRHYVRDLSDNPLQSHLYSYRYLTSDVQSPLFFAVGILLVTLFVIVGYRLFYHIKRDHWVFRMDDLSIEDKYALKQLRKRMTAVVIIVFAGLIGLHVTANTLAYFIPREQNQKVLAEYERRMEHAGEAAVATDGETVTYGASNWFGFGKLTDWVDKTELVEDSTGIICLRQTVMWPVYNAIFAFLYLTATLLLYLLYRKRRSKLPV